MIKEKDRVTVTLRDGVTFTGTVRGVEGVIVVVKFDQRSDIEARRNPNYDPDGCLCVHVSFCKVESVWVAPAVNN
jgi:small nuclear ribonucleoprotein (snRNP)-like protein